MILHIPHSSTNTLDKKFLCNLEVELDRMTDFDTDKLFDYSDATKIIFPVSRLVCDVERFEDDDLEEMSKKGMGVCYTQNAFGEPLREVTKQERSHIIEKYYRPHHKKLTDAVKQALDEDNTALVIDCHSFPNTPLPCNISQKIPRPDICIGTDSFHTPDNLLNKTVDYFKSCGYTVAINDPFTGTLIPMKYYQKDKRVQGIMIEVNRNLYKDDFELVRNNIAKWLELIYKKQTITEQDSQTKFFQEATDFLKVEAQNLTESKYNDLARMVGSKSEEITLEQAEAMLYVAKNPDEVEQMIYGSYTEKIMENH